MCFDLATPTEGTNMTLHRIILAVLSATTVLFLGGCASIRSAPVGTPSMLVTTSDFRMKLPPFVTMELPKGSYATVIGATDRKGHTYRVVTLPAPEAAALRFLLNDDGTLEGSAINASGAEMGFAYRPDPPDVQFVAPWYAEQTSSGRAASVENAATSSETGENESPDERAGEVAETPAQSAEPTEEKPDDVWGEVRCDLVAQENREACMAAHVRIGIPSDRTTASAAAPSTEPLAPRHLSCSASNGYRPIIDMQGVDPEALECDLLDCQSYAAQISPARSAVANAVAGAVFGALIGLAVGDRGWAARAGARGGAIGGAMSGAANAGAAQINTVRNCMVGRGYRVLQ